MSDLQNQPGPAATLAALQVGDVVQVTTWDEQPTTGDPTERQGLCVDVDLHLREGCYVLLPDGDEGRWRIMAFARHSIRRVEATNDGGTEIALLLQRLKNFVTFS